MVDIRQYGSNLSNQILYWLGGLVSMVLILYCIATMLVIKFIGAPPQTIVEIFSLLNTNKLEGLLRLDILTVFLIPLYYLLFYSIYIALKRTNNELLTFSTVLIFIGLTLFLASPSVFSYFHLSEQYALATTDLQKNQLLAAGEAIRSSDIWHGTSALIGGILLQTGALIVSFLMLKSNVFSKLIAYTGIFIFGLDLIHILIGFIQPEVSNILMVIAGTFYLLWFLLIGIRLFKLSTGIIN